MRTAACRIAIERLSAYLAQANADDATLDEALEHIRDCPDCRHRIGYLVRALNSAAADKLSCQDCEQRLPAYVAALAQGPAGAEWRDVALHLAFCPACAAAYGELARLVELAQGQPGAAQPAYYEPDLSFLEPKRPWRLDAVGRLVIEFTAELLASLRQPAPALGAAGLALKSGQPPVVLRPFALVGEVADEDIKITFDAARGDPTMCTVVVEVGIPSRGGWPNLGGSMVVLRRGEATLASQPTDAFGNAVFEQVGNADLERLVVVIERAGRL